MVNVVKPDTIDPAVTEKLWNDLKLEENEILKKNPKIKESLYSILNAYQNVFTSDQCSVGKTSWEEFKIELMPGARPVNQRVRPLPPPSKQIKETNLINGSKMKLLNRQIPPGHHRWFRSRKNRALKDGFWILGL